MYVAVVHKPSSSWRFRFSNLICFICFLTTQDVMATTSSESDSSRKNTENKENDNKDEQSNMFECNICLDNAKDAVVSVCGHLFWLVLLLS